MPGQKALRRLDLPSALVRRRLFLQPEKDRIRQIMPREFLWQAFQQRQNRKFF